MVAQVRKVWEAERAMPGLTAGSFALGGSWIGRGWKSVSKNRLMPCFGAQGVEERLRRFLLGWKLMTWAH